MKKYKAPWAEVVDFENDYVVAGPGSSPSPVREDDEIII